MAVRNEYEQGEFSWTDLMSHDMESASVFYRELFGWTCETQPTHGGPPYGMFRMNDHDVAGIGQMSDEMKAQGVPPVWNSYVNVEDVEATAANAKEAGAEITVPPMKVMEVGSLAYFKDPTGATVGLWQRGSHCGAGIVSEPGALCWNELVTRDPDRARAFYSQVFGWTYEVHETGPSGYRIIKTAASGKLNGGVWKMDDDWGDAPPLWMVYFAVADADASTARLKELGGSVSAPPFDTSVGKIAVVADPQGAMFSLIQLSSPPES